MWLDKIKVPCERNQGSVGATSQQSASCTSHPIGYSWGHKAGQLSCLVAGVSPPEPHQLLLMPETGGFAESCQVFAVGTVGKDTNLLS